ncbi:MAG: amino acid adenylation domain-containing protein [Acidobacteria bacterium]|nr:amino acid adenylation domain-containing protein [Acidobacteriota bacterium]MBI3421525.1 amino acid adenylation domain-containing protein [Acidobacteriota bacterium]
MSLLAQPVLTATTHPTTALRFLHQFFEHSVRQWPQRTALDIPPSRGRPARRVLSYAELSQQAEAVAAFLRPYVTGECIVALLLPRGNAFLYSGQLGALKAGAAYTCIDTAFPDEQVRDILNDSAAVVLLTDPVGQARAQRAGWLPGRVFEVAEVLAPARELPAPRPPAWLTPESLAYIIYTSGTTGRPKGVMIEHAGIVNLVRHDLLEFQLTPDARVAQNSSPSYDSSVEEIWFALAAGATLVPLDEETVRLGPDLTPWLRRERITVICPPPTLLRTLGCRDPLKELPDLAFVYAGGEALPRDIADHWATGRWLINSYGPTECSVTATHTTIKPGDPITIGKPIRGLQGYVLDAALEEVADGASGELCLAGVGLARGYRNRPELTAQKFPTHPKLGRLYRTGDLVERAPDGNLIFHGRIDAQVKLRGYRIELEAIEARLAECPGVREAACCVQGAGAQQGLAAFIVPGENAAPSFDELKAALRAVLPSYMVPNRFALINELPRTVSDKLDRKALPVLAVQERESDRPYVAPRNDLEQRLAAATQQVLELPNPVSVDDDFFNVLGGDSLHAAMLVSRLRDDPVTAYVDTRDLYEARTIAQLATRAHAEAEVAQIIEEDLHKPQGRPLLATLAQSIWLLFELVIGSTLTYFATFDALPYLIEHLGLIPFFLLSPLLIGAALLAYTPLAVAFAVLVKKLLIGRYQPLRAPVWGGFYVRNWIVQQAVRVIPWTMLEGTVFYNSALRALGARIGARVHIHRNVNLREGGWDLLDIGDDVTLSQEASLRLVDLEDGDIVVGPIQIGAGSTLEIRAGVGRHCVLEPESCLTSLSSLADGARIPRGERWDGVPAQSAGAAPPRPDLPDDARVLSPVEHGLLMLLARFALALLLALPLELPVVLLAVVYGFDAEAALDWLALPSLTARLLLAGLLYVVLPAPLTLLLEAAAMRALGRVPTGVISLWSPAYVRVWLKTELVKSANDWLSGTLFWPLWLRLAGMKIGRGCEISTITDVVPEHIEIGKESFFADGIYLGGPVVQRGTVTLSQTRLAQNTFLGNHVVIPSNQQLPPDILIGVSTVADDRVVRPGSSWFGHPPFELPRREIVEADRSLTHEPSWLRYLNRVFWELLRFVFPVVPVLVLPFWYRLLMVSEKLCTRPVFRLAVMPAASLGLMGFFCLLVLALKWGLLGRVRPGVHPLWSCWTYRWDFLYVAWQFFASPVLLPLEGTLLLAWYLRAMGMEIGRGVVLGRGFTQVVDPDMLHFEDGATVCCQFQAHTFEDRVLKIDHVRIRRRATVTQNTVLLYGADIGEHTQVAPHSVVMKRESLLPNRFYAGCPTRPLARPRAESE